MLTFYGNAFSPFARKVQLILEPCPPGEHLFRKEGKGITACIRCGAAESATKGIILVEPPEPEVAPKTPDPLPTPEPPEPQWPAVTA